MGVVEGRGGDFLFLWESVPDTGACTVPVDNPHHHYQSMPAGPKVEGSLTRLQVPDNGADASAFKL